MQVARLLSPSASSAQDDLADWLEVYSVTRADRSSSIQDLVGELRRNSSVEALSDSSVGDIDRGSERTQAIAESALERCDDRRRICGSSYPFTVSGRSLKAHARATRSIYFFLLLLSKFGKKVGPPESKGESLFERLSTHAALNYLGGSAAGAEAYHFGFPRSRPTRGFRAALDELCSAMQEGGQASNSPSRKDQKDGHLDLVAWKSFCDGRVGKLIAFGQCATGQDWEDKKTELAPDAFCELWMAEVVPVKPLRLFFVPHTVPGHKWLEVCRYAGILLDRCRIVPRMSGLHATLKSEAEAWSRHVVDNLEIGA